MLAYRQPPLLEALCEFRFTSAEDAPWDGTIPGLLYARIADVYPIRTESPALDGGNSRALPRMRARFSSPDGTRVVQVGQDLLVVNAVAPHLGWPLLRSESLRVFQEYRAIARPSAVRTIGVRYINRITVPWSPTASLDEYFALLPAVPIGLAEHLREFVVGGKLDYSDAAGELRFSFKSDEVGPDHAVFFLELVHVQDGDESSSSEQVHSALDLAHDRIELAFYGSCTARCHREIFEEDAT